MRSRRGYSLIECLVVISLVGVTLTTVAMTLHAMNRAERRLRDDTEHSETMARLAAQLRSDAHQADTATIPTATLPVATLPQDANSTRTLRLSFSGGRSVEYKLDERGVDRIASLQGTVQHRETYIMRMGKDSRWEIDANRQRPLVSLSVPLSSGIGTNNAPPTMCRLLAAVHIADQRQAKGE